MPEATTDEFEEAAYAAFVDTLGESGVDAFRWLVSFYRPTAATGQAAWLDLSANDQQIFAAVARRLWREQAEQPA
jgi:hypothetical protein